MIQIKTKKQIEGIRKSGRLAARCLQYITPWVQPGISTAELNSLLDNYIREQGAIPACQDYQGFPKATCISVNEVVCHGIPGPQVLKDGDIVGIDVTTILGGYFGDTCITYPVGNIGKEAADLMDATRRCLDAGIAVVRPGNRFGKIGAVISAIARAEGYGVVNMFCGHGVGLRFHEEPQVPHIARETDGPVMKPGMVFTIEPMLCSNSGDVVICEQDGWTVRTADGGLSAQFEHTIAVMSDGCEVLTVP